MNPTQHISSKSELYKFILIELHIFVVNTVSENK